MNKPIIIDGVDASGCRRRIGKNNYCRYFKRPCAENNFNCIWKQYERLKAENEDLKFYIDSYRQTWELDKYKKALEEVREIASDALDIIVENDELLCYVGHIYNIINEVLKDE